jgi:hypothetical protein
LARLSLLLVALAIGLSGCSRDDSPPIDAAAALRGVGEGALPNGRKEVRALFEALPREVAGRSRTPSRAPRWFEAVYGKNRMDLIYLRAIPIEDVRAFAGGAKLSPVQFLRLAVRDERPEAKALDPAARVVYVLGTTTETGKGFHRSIYTADWARPNGRWIFVAIGDTPESRGALVAAFVRAARR